MNYKKGTEGTLNFKDHFLNGTKAKFIKRNSSGSMNVELMEDNGAYKAGDVMVVGPGEWKERK